MIKSGLGVDSLMDYGLCGRICCRAMADRLQHPAAFDAASIEKTLETQTRAFRQNIAKVIRMLYGTDQFKMRKCPMID